MRERWESLRFPHPDGKGGTVYKVDRVAVDLAINGLKIKWWSAPPMSSRDNPPVPVVTSLSKSLTLLPLVEQWVERGIVTGDLTVIPETVHFSRLFSVTKKNGGLRPVLDLSFLNTFILTPQLKMEAISSILPHLSRGMWASSLDVTDAFLSVKLSLPIQKYFCFFPEWESLYVPKAPLWSDHGSLGLLKTHETNQEVFKITQTSGFVLPGRLPYCGPSQSIMLHSHDLGSRPSRMAGFHDQREKVREDSLSDHYLLRGTDRSQENDCRFLQTMSTKSSLNARM